MPQFDEMLPYGESSRPVVYIEEEGCFGVIVQENSFYSVIAWYKDGVYHERWIDINDF